MILSCANLPTLTSHWEWQSWRDLPYLTCRLLKDWQHGFFTQHASYSPEELVAILQPDAQAYRVRQVHGNRVLTPSEITARRTEAGPSFPDADGVLSDDKHQGTWVASADCTPVLIGDLDTGRVAAVHAGWRGTAQRIVPAAIAKFLDGGCSLPNLRIAMGPAIAGEVYQVSETVAAEVGASLVGGTDSPQAILAALREFSDSPLLDDPMPGRVRLDVRRVNALQLKQLGIEEEQVAIAPLCTYQQPDCFYSYRRSKQKQVQWSGIVSN